MPTIQVEAELSKEEMLKAAEQLDSAELQQFISQLLSLRARRHGTPLNAEESDLLIQINRGLPEALRKRSDELIAKRRSGTLSAEEHQELLGLTEQVEKQEGDRLAALAQLAQIRETPLSALMDQLGINNGQ